MLSANPITLTPVSVSSVLLVSSPSPRIEVRTKNVNPSRFAAVGNIWFERVVLAMIIRSIAGVTDNRLDVGHVSIFSKFLVLWRIITP